MLRTALRKRLRPSDHFQVLQTQKICCYIRAFRDFLNRHVINRAENLLYWEYLSLAYTIEGVTISSDQRSMLQTHTDTLYTSTLPPTYTFCDTQSQARTHPGTSTFTHTNIHVILRGYACTHTHTNSMQNLTHKYATPLSHTSKRMHTHTHTYIYTHTHTHQ